VSVADLDPIGALDAEAEELDHFLSTLTGEDWCQPSACAGWSVSDVVLHLAQSEEGVIAAFDVGDAGTPYAPYVDGVLARAVAGDVVGDGAVDAIVAAAVTAERPADPARVLERWRAAHAGVVARLRAADPSQRVPWISVPLSARTLASTRLAEHWIHGMDVREPLGHPARDTERLWLIARLAWRTLPYAFAGVGETAPVVALHLDAPGGGRWDFDPDPSEMASRDPDGVVAGSDAAGRGDDGSAVKATITGSAGAWCRLAARRKRPAEVALHASGPGGRRVLELVRTYA
jgi:uncharacterized protein (TIGR03084 family)